MFFLTQESASSSHLPTSEPEAEASSSSESQAPRKKSCSSSHFVITSASEKEHLTDQWARAFFKNRIPFSVANDPEFKKAMEMMRPGVGDQLLSRKRLAGPCLDKEYDKIDGQMRNSLQGKEVVMSQDGWSNVNREPIIASCLHVPGHSFLHDAIDVGDVTKDAEYCADLAKKSMESSEEKYGCKVIGFVSDNENKMLRVRSILEEWRGKTFIAYGCSAHYLNLVQAEATPPQVKGQLVEVQKFFRNHQRPAAQLKIKGGKSPQLPNETRWLSHREFLETFLYNYQFYLDICDEDSCVIPPNIKRILNNRQIKEGANHMLSQLNMVSQSLNLLQSDSSNLGDATNTWLMLSSSQALTDELKEAVQARMENAITPFHMLAKMLLNRAGWEQLPIRMKEAAMKLLLELDPSFPGIMAAFETEDDTLFPASAFMQSIKEVLEPIKYWQYIAKNTEMEPVQKFCQLAIRVLSCPTSSAGD